METATEIYLASKWNEMTDNNNLYIYILDTFWYFQVFWIITCIFDYVMDIRYKIINIFKYINYDFSIFRYLIYFWARFGSDSSDIKILDSFIYFRFGIIWDIKFGKISYLSL